MQIEPSKNNRLEQVEAEPQPARLPEAEGLSGARARALERYHALTVAWKAKRAERAENSALSRRDACVAAGSAAVAAAAWALLGRSASSAEVAPRSQGLFHLEQAGRFAWETLLFECGQVALSVACKALRLPVGNAAMGGGMGKLEVPKSAIFQTLEMFEKDPHFAAKLYGEIGLLAPVKEEILFRLLPGLLVRQRGGMQWGVGIPSSLIFAAAHNFTPLAGGSAGGMVGLGDSSGSRLNVVPLPQFLLGAYCWYVMRRYGDLAPFVAHAFNNQASALALCWGGKAMFAEFQRLLSEELEALNERG